MINSAEESEWRQSKNLKQRGELSQYCVSDGKLTGRCTKDSFDPDDKEVGQEQFS